MVRECDDAPRGDVCADDVATVAAVTSQPVAAADDNDDDDDDVAHAAAAAAHQCSCRRRCGSLTPSFHSLTS